jgi:hypothetical protein
MMLKVNQVNPLFHVEKCSISLSKSSQTSFAEGIKDGLHRPAKIDSTNPKIPSLLEEPFERKWSALA